MADVREQRIFSAEQIFVPPELPVILKHYAKEVIRSNPGDIVEFSAKYFRDLLEKRSKRIILSPFFLNFLIETSQDKNAFSEIQKPDSKYQS